MHPEIEKLIDLSLVDGQITEKERAVIIKKAMSLGIEKDEIEIILDAKIHEFNNSKTEKNSNKLENTQKCPSCNNVISGLSKTCTCGYVINSGDIKNSKSLEDAIEILENLIVEIRSLKEKPNKILEESISAKIDKEIRYIKVRYYDNIIVKKLINELEELSKNAIISIKKKRQRKKTIAKTLIIILILISGFVFYFLATYKTPEEKFNLVVNELYRDKILEYKKTKQYINDSLMFYSAYDDLLKGALNYTDENLKIDDVNKRFDQINLKQPTAFKYYCLARKITKNGDINNSKKYFDTCIALYPKFAPNYFNLFAFNNEKFDIRLQNLNKAIELDKDKNRYKLNMSILYFENKDYVKAFDFISEFNIENRNNLNSNLFEILILLNLELNDEACNKYSSLMDKFSNEINSEKNKNNTLLSIIEKTCE